MEDKKITEAPSSTFVQHTFLPQAFTMIWKGMEEGIQGSVSLFQSKEKTLVLGGGSVEIGEITLV